MQTKTLQQINEEWKDTLEDADLGIVVKDKYKQRAIALMLENQATWNGQNARFLAEAAPENNYGDGQSNIKGWDPVLINMLRRAAPQMIPFDVCGVQPMTMPTGLVFAIKARYGDGTADLTDNVEALFDEANTASSGTGTQTGTDPATQNETSPGTYSYGTGKTTAQLEALGDGVTAWQTMGLTIEKIAVQAKGRALKANYTNELVQDLRAVHGLDAEQELSHILTTELLFDINRETVRTIYNIAEKGAQATTNAGTFDLDLDSNGRWSVEKFKGLLFQIERDANQIATRTRRGKGNFIVCSQDVASALSLVGKLDYAPAIDAQTNLAVDASNSTYCGILNGRMKVYVDPYLSSTTGNEFAVIGYKGTNPMDAGLFYCPYVALEMYKTTVAESLQPTMGFKVRYGMVTNPFANSSGTAGSLTQNVNKYYRKIRIRNIM